AVQQCPFLYSVRPRRHRVSRLACCPSRPPAVAAGRSMLKPTPVTYPRRILEDQFPRSRSEKPKIIEIFSNHPSKENAAETAEIPQPRIRRNICSNGRLA